MSGVPLGITPADGARAVAQVYTWALLSTIPLVAGWVAALVPARATASSRALASRSTVLAVLAAFVAQQLPMRWVAWVLPDGLATPLVALGRMQVGGATRLGWDASSLLVALILAAYAAGVFVALAALASDLVAVHRFLRAARPVTDRRWLRDLAAARGTLSVRRRVRLLVSDDRAAPASCGILRPAVVVPRAALQWNGAERRALLLHEVAHVGAGDVPALLLARVACALCWFHPLAWLALRRLRHDCELACDDRVLAAGVRRSDYASLLLRATGLLQSARLPAATLAMARGAGIRERIAAIADPSRDLRTASRARRAAAAACTLVLSAPLGALRPAPTRDVLTALMGDARWEVRAYAVIGLAQRPDSVAVAQRAARLDPSARVRAAASSAVAQAGFGPVPVAAATPVGSPPPTLPALRVPHRH